MLTKIERLRVRLLGRAILFLLLVCSAPAGAALPEDAAPTGSGGAAPVVASAPAAEPAIFTVLSREVVVLRAPFLGVSPRERVAASTRRLREMVRRGVRGDVALSELPQGTMITVDGSHLLVITPGDLADPLTDTTTSVAQRAAQTLTLIATETRQARNLKFMLTAAGQAAAALAVTLLLLWGLLRARRAVLRRMIEVAERKTERLSAHGRFWLKSVNAARVVGWLVSMSLILIVLLVSYQAVAFILGRFPFTRPWSEQLSRFFLDLVTGLATSIAAAIPNLVVALAIFAVARVLIGAGDRVLGAVQQGQVNLSWMGPDSARPTRQLFAFATWMFALAMAYPYLPGSHSEAFKGISVLVGLMISLGGTSVVSHAGSGLILMYTGAYRRGDYVRIGEHEGTIIEIGTFTTRMRTGLGEEIVLPNAVVIGATTKNYSRAAPGSLFVLDTTVTIGYDTPWRQVEAMLTEAAGRTPGVIKTPAPRVFQTALADFYVEYRLVTLASPVEPRPRAEMLSELHRNVQDVFNEYGVQIMSPHYMLDPAGAKIVPKADWYPAPAQPPGA
jgi:small-conductance mechanosensitive channel